MVVGGKADFVLAVGEEANISCGLCVWLKVAPMVKRRFYEIDNGANSAIGSNDVYLSTEIFADV